MPTFLQYPDLNDRFGTELPRIQRLDTKNRMCVQNMEAIKNSMESIHFKPAAVDSEVDIKKINSALLMLKTSGWFYENITRQQAKKILQNSDEGAFLLRNSSDPKHLFALSIRTQRGTTSVRIAYELGKFRLDCEDSLSGQMPLFDDIIELVNFYIKLSKHNTKKHCVWLESCGRRDLPVLLVKPVSQQVSSLQHLCRKTIMSNLGSKRDIAQLPLPKPLQTYIKEYPHAL